MKIKLLCLFLLVGSLARSAAAIDLGSPASRTPYDAYMGPVWEVLRGSSGGELPISAVEQLVRQGRAFRYVYKSTQPYLPQAPEETDSIKAGDCKAKSVWLAWKMHSGKVRYVVGKAKRGANLSHAWLIWEGPEGWLILDATMYSRPLSPDRISANEYIPIYSYAKGGKYVHTVGAAARGERDGDH